MGIFQAVVGQRVRLSRDCGAHHVGAMGTAAIGFAGIMGVHFDGDDPDLISLSEYTPEGRVEVLSLCENLSLRLSVSVGEVAKDFGVLIEGHLWSGSTQVFYQKAPDTEPLIARENADDPAIDKS